MGSHVAAPVLYSNLKYDSTKDFVPVGLTANAPVVIVARKDFPAKDMREFVAYLKEHGVEHPLLDTGEAAGVLMPSGCRMGVCFGCAVPLRRGAVRAVRTGDLTTAAEGDGVVIQTCISAAAGACDIDI